MVQRSVNGWLLLKRTYAGEKLRSKQLQQRFASGKKQDKDLTQWAG